MGDAVVAGELPSVVNLDIRPPGARGAQPASRVAQVVARLLESRGAEGIRRLEVRWILPGRLESEVTGWLGRFPGQAEILEDVYLIDRDGPGISAKIRAGTVFEVKVYQGSPGVLRVAGRDLGRMEYWHKWSFPGAGLGRAEVGSAAWLPVRKRRRVSRFSLTGTQTGCAVELTEVRVQDQDWWSLGFEATGPDDQLRGELEAVTSRVFAGPLLDPAKFGPHNSRSYADWLRDAF
jgi:hypothetical protein